MVSSNGLNMGNVLAIGVGGALFLSGDFTIGTGYLFFQYQRLKMLPLMGLSEKLQNL